MSGTVNAAQRVMQEMNANIVVIDSWHVSGTLGFMVEAAARAAKAGWQHEQIVQLVERVGQASKVIFSPDVLKYLVYGGRVSHLRGFAATMLNIKPILAVGYASGSVESLATARTMKKAAAKQVDMIAAEHGEGASLRLQIVHADNPTIASLIKDKITQRFDCLFCQIHPSRHW